MSLLTNSIGTRVIVNNNLTGTVVACRIDNQGNPVFDVLLDETNQILSNVPRVQLSGV